MPCICGIKVDRQDVNKILCINCKQYMHYRCINIKISEIDRLKNAFKCQKCVSGRRLSLVSSPAVNSITHSNSDVVAVNDSVVGTALAASVVVAADNANSCALADVADTNVAIGAGIIDLTNASSSSAQTAQLHSSADVIVGVSCAKLDAIYSEMLALKSDNVRLTNLVTSLHDSNKKLLAKFDALELTVHMQNSMSTSSTSSKKPVNNKNNANSNVSKSWASIVATDAVNNSLSPALATAATAMQPNIGHTIASVKNNNQHHVSTVPSAIARSVPLESAVNIDNSTSATEMNANWNIIKSQSKRKKAVIGTSTSNELNVIAKFKWLHLASFANTVTETEIISYLTKHTQITESHFACHKLVKKDAIISDMKFINFKLGVSACFYDRILNSTLWPANIRVRPFRFLEKQTLSPGTEGIQDLALQEI